MLLEPLSTSAITSKLHILASGVVPYSRTSSECHSGSTTLTPTIFGLKIIQNVPNGKCDPNEVHQ